MGYNSNMSDYETIFIFMISNILTRSSATAEIARDANVAVHSLSL